MRFSKEIARLKARRQRIVDGLFNCIPLSFKRFRKYLPGIEKERFIIITANQKVGKSKLADYMFIYEPLFFIMKHPEVRMHILYFTLEMSPSAKYDEFLCFLLYKLDNIRVSPTELRSTSEPVDDRVFELLDSDKYQEYIKKYEEMVEYIDDERNPTGIHKRCRDYALTHGHLNFTTVETIGPLGEKGTREIIDINNSYTPDDPEEYMVAIVDNASNLQSERSLDKRDTIDKLAKYGINLRNQLKYTFVLIQHQAQAQEGIENQKLNKLYPSVDGLADCKTTSRDANLILGLFNPFKYGLTKYGDDGKGNSYDITKFKNHIRFLMSLDDRDNESAGNICPLWFDGATSYFCELPEPSNKEELSKVYRLLESINEKKSIKTFFMKSVKKLFNKK